MPTKAVDENRVIRTSQLAIISSALPVANTMAPRFVLPDFPGGALDIFDRVKLEEKLVGPCSAISTALRMKASRSSRRNISLSGDVQASRWRLQGNLLVHIGAAAD